MKHLLFTVLVSTFSFSVFAAGEKSKAPQIVEISVTENGFEPELTQIKGDAPVILKVTRKTKDTCATEIVIKDSKVKEDLPLNKVVTIDLGKLKKGDHEFACGMDMFKGKIQVIN